VRRLSLRDCQGLAAAALQSGTAAEVRARLGSFVAQHPLGGRSC
jgi:hypothetical protein